MILVGDSVLNGGRYISNTELVNTVLGQKYPNIDFLNISAGSWGADNAFEYIKKYGHYEAKKIVMVFSSHDAGDCIEHNTVLGNSQFPTQKPCCAWGEFLEKIYLKFKPRDFSNEHGITKNIKGCEFNSGWNDFVKYSRDNNISLYSVLHAETSEIDAQEYSENGQKLIMFFEENNIKYVLDLNKTDKKYYRDSIHFNEDGHKFLADLISGLLESE